MIRSPLDENAQTPDSVIAHMKELIQLKRAGTCFKCTTLFKTKDEVYECN